MTSPTTAGRLAGPPQLDVRRVLVAGDSHGDAHYLALLTEVANRNSCQVVFIVGDFGYLEHFPPGVRLLDQVDAMTTLAVEGADRRDLVVVFLDGNHENHPLLWERYPPLAAGPWAGFAQLRDRVLYAPRGHAWTWSGVRLLALGGADSVDKDFLVPGVSWWPTEMIRYRDIDAALTEVETGPPVDVLLSHDAPALADVPRIGRALPGVVGEFPLQSANRQALQGVIDAACPQIVIHGHMHVRYRDDIRLPDGTPTRVEGLACNAEADERSWIVLDLASGKPQVPSR